MHCTFSPNSSTTITVTTKGFYHSGPQGSSHTMPSAPGNVLIAFEHVSDPVQMGTLMDSEIPVYEPGPSKVVLINVSASEARAIASAILSAATEAK